MCIRDRAGDLQPLTQRAGRQDDVEQAVAAVGDGTLEHRSAGDGAADAGRKGLGDLTGTERAFECGGGNENYWRHRDTITEAINEKPSGFPQRVIACRTPCALEPDVSEANSFSHWGRRYGLRQPGCLNETPSFAPRRHRRFALFESSDQNSKQIRCPVVTTVTATGSQMT